MSAINLFWQLDITDTTKYLLIISVILFIFFICYKNKNKKKGQQDKIKDDYYGEYTNKKKSTQCHKRYMNCVENNIKNNSDEFCYPCINDGLKQDFFYDPVSKEWLSSK